MREDKRLRTADMRAISGPDDQWLARAGVMKGLPAYSASEDVSYREVTNRQKRDASANRDSTFDLIQRIDRKSGGSAMSKNNLYIERREEQRDYAVKHAKHAKPLASAPTQAEAIEIAK